jgi:agmatinase
MNSMSLPFVETTFISAKAPFSESTAVILGCPFDGTASFRPGARFGPGAIRKASWGIETFSPYLEQDLTELNIHDWGDLDLPLGDKKISFRLIQEGLRQILSGRKFPILLGGDHLITFPVVEEMLRLHPQLHLVHIDAHTDLREDYLGDTLSHSTVMMNLLGPLGQGRLSQIGIRSGTGDEFRLAKRLNTLVSSRPASVRSLVKRLKNLPVYISLDLDVIDPSLLPGVGTPEPGGLSFREFIDLLKELRPLRVVGFDMVELTPDYDPTQVSAVTAAVILREMILAFCPSHR